MLLQRAALCIREALVPCCEGPLQIFESLSYIAKKGCVYIVRIVLQRAAFAHSVDSAARGCIYTVQIVLLRATITEC
eukprot:1160641-Pelagomonas_calceolata.AAC.11